jgi:malic enzyme
MAWKAQQVTLAQRLKHQDGHHTKSEGSTVMDNRYYNKMTAFSLDEREELGLRGLLPPVVETLESQRERMLKQLREFDLPINRYIYLAQLQGRNTTLFHSLLLHNLEEMLPIVYTPTVGLACQHFGAIWRVNSGLYLSHRDRGAFRRILDNWKGNVDIIVVTDGSRILGLGDLGTNGMGIPIGKLALYVAAAGFDPQRCLPVTIDTGTNNEELRADPAYMGSRVPRILDDEYYPVIDEFMTAVKDKWPSALIQFEDISNDHCFNLLERYRHDGLIFNDDIQGTGAVVAAGYLSLLKLQKLTHADQRIVFLGAGSSATGIADQMVRIMVEDEGLDEDVIRERFYFVDSRGLVAHSRGDELQDHKVPYSRNDIEKGDYAKLGLDNLAGVVKHVNPTLLIGCSSTPGAFDQEILGHMAATNAVPGIFSLSNPTSQSECSAEDAYKFTDGRAVFASGSPYDPVRLADGTLRVPGQANNFLCFPGLGFGSFLSESTKVTDRMVSETARALAQKTTDADLALGRIFPAVDNIRDISAHIAVKVIQEAKRGGVSRLDRDDIDDYTSIINFVRDNMYEPVYRDYLLSGEAEFL